MEPIERQTAPVQHSPCVGVCTLDGATGWCLGCGRSGDEVARWIAMSDAERLACWADLPSRLERVSVQVRLLPWTPARIADWVGKTLGAETGTFVVGMPGALAEFPCGPAQVVELSRGPDAVFARAAKAAFRLRLHEKLRAFAFGRTGPIVLGLPKARIVLPIAATLTLLGADHKAVDTQHRERLLFDFGLGRAGSRFLIRTGEPALAASLRAHCGSPWQSVMAAIGPTILANGPHRVVESALARIEVLAPIPAPGTLTPQGAHTHFLPEFLQDGEEAPPGLALPDYALPVAIYYPPEAG
jgi:predicted Fe-S protein YdhL (DUF1289 family)